MADGAPLLLDLFAEARVPVTFFTTGETATRFPDFVERLLAEGHELGCHGMTHRAFTSMTREEAEREIQESSAILRAWAPVTAFRAPYLRFPDDYLGLLEAAEYRVDSSRGIYKPTQWRPSAPTTLTRVPASISSSWIRLPRAIRDALLRRLGSPVVLFVHPWEFVDMGDEPIPWDCRAGTGRPALEALRSAIGLLQEEGADFRRISEVA
jgi:peptidoglycan/xylan/chitin deacetylase (PgdA/CDA1 family)